MTTPAPDNPFAAREIGELYRRGRPYRHPRSLEHVLSVVRAAGASVDVERGLDVACGTGMSTIAFADRARTVVGLDISLEMMSVAPSAPNVTYMLGDAERLGFVPGAFDAVTCSSGVHWFDQTRFFAELQRVVRPGGWAGLYDHYFMKMEGVDGFRDWTTAVFERFPLPARNPQVGDPRSETPIGFELLGSEFFEDPIVMSQEQFVDYQLSVSHCVAAAERGMPRAEIRSWLNESIAPLFGDVPTRTLQFLVSVTCLRRLP